MTERVFDLCEPVGSDGRPPCARITLRRNSDGKSVSFLDDWTAHTQTADLTLHNVWWQWTEGNFCCDCNRHLEFHRHSDPPSNPIDDEIPCYDEQTGGNQYALVGFAAE